MNGVSNKSMRGSWRRVLFAGWVIASAIVGFYVGAAGFFAGHFAAGPEIVALAVPGLMFFMLATGVGWLVLLVMSRRGPARQDQTERARDRLRAPEATRSPG